MTERTHPFDLTGRTVLVTGASSGIGRATAIVLSGLGARVVLTARRIEQLLETRSLMTAGEHAVEPFDVGEAAAVPDWMKGLAARHGPFDGLVHSAGVQRIAALRGVSISAVDDIFRVNVDAAVMLAKGFRQRGCSSPRSSVVFLSSVAAFVGSPATSVYAASKAALIGLARSLAVELAREGVRVNCIAAGMVESPMVDGIRRSLTAEQFAARVAQHPLGLGTTWDVACAAAYLLSDAGQWITGQVLVVDGGFSAQ